MTGYSMDRRAAEDMVIQKMKYSERLAHYEREKMELPRTKNDSRTYEQALKMLAKKWRV